MNPTFWVIWRKDRGRWIVKVSEDGRTRQMAVPANLAHDGSAHGKRAVEQWAMRELTHPTTPATPTPQSEPPLSELTRLFLDYAKQDERTEAATLAGYRRNLEDACAFVIDGRKMGALSAPELTTQRLRQYVRHLRKQHESNTVRNKISSLAKCITIARAEGWTKIGTNPVKDEAVRAELPEIERRDVEVLPDEAVAALISSPRIPLVWKLWYAFGALAGMEAGTIAGLKVGDVDVEVDGGLAVSTTQSRGSIGRRGEGWHHHAQPAMVGRDDEGTGDVRRPRTTHGQPMRARQEPRVGFALVDGRDEPGMVDESGAVEEVDGGKASADDYHSVQGQQGVERDRNTQQETQSGSGGVWPGVCGRGQNTARTIGQGNITFAIRRAVKLVGPDGHATPGRTKNQHRGTEKAPRRIPAHPALVRLLDVWLGGGWALWAAVGRGPQPGDWLLPPPPPRKGERPANERGWRPKLSEQLRAHLALLRIAAPDGAQEFKQLRAWFATTIERTGASESVRKRLMGHRGMSTAARHYTAEQRDLDRRAIEAIRVEVRDERGTEAQGSGRTSKGTMGSVRTGGHVVRGEPHPDPNYATSQVGCGDRSTGKCRVGSDPAARLHGMRVPDRVPASAPWHPGDAEPAENEAPPAGIGPATFGLGNPGRVPERAGARKRTPQNPHKHAERFGMKDGKSLSQYDEGAKRVPVYGAKRKLFGDVLEESRAAIRALTDTWLALDRAVGHDDVEAVTEGMW